MTVRRFKLTFEDDGSELTYFCAAFESEAAREQAFAGIASTPAAVPQIEPERPRGRPSYDGVLSEAVAALQLDPARPLAERARRVLKYLAQTCSDPADIPNARTVERHLAGAPARQKSRHKSRQKLPRAKLAATGG